MKTKQQEAGETENQAVKSAKKRGRPRKSHECSGSLLDNTKKGRHCLSDKQDNRKELSPRVEKLPYFRSSTMEKEAGISNRDKLVEVIPNGDDKKTKEQEAGETKNQAIKSAKKRGRQRKSRESSGSLLDNKTKEQEAGETENQAIKSAKKRGRQRKSCESSGSSLDNIKRERHCLSDKHDNRKELSPHVEKSPYFGSSNMEKEDYISNCDKTVEVIPNGDDKTKEQEAGETENQAIKSAKKRERSQISELFVSCPRKRRKGCPSRSNLGTSTKIADTKNSEAMIKELEVCDMSGDSEGVKGTQVENSFQSPIENGQKGDAETSSEIKGNGEHPEHPKLPVADLQTARAGEELSAAGGVFADCATEKSELPVTTEVILTDTLEEGTTLVFPKPMKISSDDQASLMHIVETHAPTNVSESGNIGRTNVQNFPFVKSCPIWEIIESMEVFKKLPQNPNFQPLMKCKALKREGAAIAHMMNFAYVVEKISKLQENDSRQDLESIMEELAELEEMGFDVKVIWGRVTELVQVKVELEKLMHKSNGVETRIEKCSIEKTEIDGEVADIDKELKRLEEKRAKLMSERMDKDSEEFKLISEANDINIGISTTRERFRSLVVTPFGA
ncbi:DUF724 domain-containing protein 3 isoform X2 [Morus notabilis]|uniref:DUF724 domain-containing protein 3 isoform X2 n=1 Tax=Morus notabilis TaxID=981085 RepID=UPI000CECF7BD|nr:DUF724 domain-containing protein 3 isoform X2 [Morus notabilis]